MECNKDEAVRARQIAEARMQRGEFVEALKFATKAKKLYANVENITQILTVCEVHNAALKKLSGSDMDWYAVLQIEGLADEATIKKQYRRLALLLHPDKNKFAGAEAAFKLIGQANGVLSDQAKRSLYDKKFGASVRGATPKTSHHYSNGNVFAPKHDANATNYQKSSDSHHYSNGNAFAAKYDANAANYQKNSYPNSTGSNNQAGQIVFWTFCQHCETKHQYCVPVLNATLQCQKCLKSFKARVVDFGYQGVSASVFTSVNIQKEAPMPCSPKPASESTGGIHLGRQHAGTSVQSNPTSVKNGAPGVGSRYEGEKSKDSYVPAFKDMESQASKNVGSKRVRQSASDATNYQKNNSDSHQYSNGNVFTAKHDANATNYQKNSYPNSTGSNKQAGKKTFWTSCQHCNTKYQYCIPFVNATLRCVKCLKSFKARAIPFVYQGVSPEFTSVNIQRESPMHDPPKPVSESTGGKPLGGEHAGKRSSPVSMKKCAAGVGVHCEGEKTNDSGYVPVSRGMKSQTSKNVGSKRARQSAPDSGEILKARNGEEMKDANILRKHVDPSRVNARSSRKKQHV